MKELVSRATELHALGLNVMPLKAGSKEPLRCWKRFQTSRLPVAAMSTLFHHRGLDTPNLAIVGGRTSRNFFALDLDSLEEYERFGSILSGMGLSTWTRRSHNGGHYYFLCEEGPVKSLGKVKENPFELKGDGQYVFLTGIHPETGELIELDKIGFPEPRTISLKVLNKVLKAAGEKRVATLTGYNRAGQQSKGLPEVADLVLVVRDTSRWADDNSRAEFAAVKSLRGAGYSEKDALTHFKTSCPPHYKKVGEKNFIQNVFRPAWDSSVPGGARRKTQSSYDAYIKGLSSLALPGRTGATDKAVLRALAKRMLLDNNDVFRATYRELAELSGRGLQAVQASVKRLEKVGYLIPVGHNKTEGSTYRLDISKVPVVAGQVGESLVSIEHDAFHFNALGAAGAEILTWLELNPRAKVTDIVKGTERAKSTVQSKLKAMAEHGLVCQDIDGDIIRWSACADANPSRLGEVARAKGTYGRSDTRNLQHTKERENYLWNTVHKELGISEVGPYLGRGRQSSHYSVGVSVYENSVMMNGQQDTKLEEMVQPAWGPELPEESVYSSSRHDQQHNSPGTVTQAGSKATADIDTESLSYLCPPASEPDALIPPEEEEDDFAFLKGAQSIFKNRTVCSQSFTNKEKSPEDPAPRNTQVIVAPSSAAAWKAR